MRNLPAGQTPEILPDYFFRAPLQYGAVTLLEPDNETKSNFIWALNSPIASKRAGRLISYAIGHGMTIVELIKVTNDQALQIVQVTRPKLTPVILPRNGILRLNTSDTLRGFWDEVKAGIEAYATDDADA